ncbi:hypothetical protein [Flexibacterium corallicola]|uniref:hypothetical protein n=1 Tax=Flexibacterium corallicola TaxID=3037259 RepID=UPI00286F3C1C|nr:hypothetical protein [Pseudovibrio sp. M1P-2-3]
MKYSYIAVVAAVTLSAAGYFIFQNMPPSAEKVSHAIKAAHVSNGVDVTLKECQLTFKTEQEDKQSSSPVTTTETYQTADISELNYYRARLFFPNNSQSVVIQLRWSSVANSPVELALALNQLAEPLMQKTEDSQELTLFNSGLL